MGCNIPSGFLRSLLLVGRRTGNSTDIPGRSGNQVCDLHKGVISRTHGIPSDLILVRHLPIRQKGGKAYPLTVFQGLCESIHGCCSRVGSPAVVCWYSFTERREAKRSTVHGPLISISFWKIHMSRAHSEESDIVLDSLSASWFIEPGRCSAEIVRSQHRHQSHTSSARL